MKAKLLLLIFVLGAVVWSLAVTLVAAQNRFEYPPFDIPWAGIALGTLGGFLIGALGLRMYAKVSHKEALRKLRETMPPTVVVSPWNERPAPFEQEHRQPYICNRSVVR